MHVCVSVRACPCAIALGAETCASAECAAVVCEHDYGGGLTVHTASGYA